jgi:hypothetical protein
MREYDLLETEEPQLVQCECGAWRYEGGLEIHRELEHTR